MAEETGRKKIDIFNIQPSTISRDLSGKSYMFYGGYKTGKTSVAVKFPRHFVLGFEKGWNLLSGVFGQPITKWKDALDVKKQLLTDAEQVRLGKKEQTKYQTIIMDTAGIAYTMCEKYTLVQEGVDNMSDTEDKRGYKKCLHEFEDFVNDLVKAGYTFIAICHAVTVEVKINGVKVEQTRPEIDKRGLAFLGGLVDVLGYVSNDKKYTTDKAHSVLFQRGSEDALLAGNRNPYSSTMIPFTYDALLKDMQQAIDKLEEEGATVTDIPTDVYKDASENLSYETLMESIQDMAKKCVAEQKVDIYLKVVEKYLGKGKKVSMLAEDQTDLLQLIYDELTELM